MRTAEFLNGRWDPTGVRPKRVSTIRKIILPAFSKICKVNLKGSSGQKLNMKEDTFQQPTPEAIFDGTATTANVSYKTHCVKKNHQSAPEHRESNTQRSKQPWWLNFSIMNQMVLVKKPIATKRIQIGLNVNRLQLPLHNPNLDSKRIVSCMQNAVNVLNFLI